MPARVLVLLAAATVVVGACASPSSEPAETAGEPSSEPAEPTTSGEPSCEPAEPTTSGDRAGRWPSLLDDLDPAEPARWTVEVRERLPHDPGAFTQGLQVLEDGRFLESTGLRGRSTIRIVEPSTGAVLQREALLAEEFGEGATGVGDTVVQLTWKRGTARRWTLPALEPLSGWRYEGEGWGLCLIGERLAMTDGSSTLTFRSPIDFSIIERVTVTLAGDEVVDLNELECVDGHVIANVWQTETIVVIRPDGAVVAVVDGGPLVDEIDADNPLDAVLNGIAVRDAETLWLTGKLWPTVFGVRVVES